MNLDFRYSFKFILLIYISSAIIGGYALAIVGGISGGIGHHFNLDSHQMSVLLGLVFFGWNICKNSLVGCRLYWSSGDDCGFCGDVCCSYLYLC